MAATISELIAVQEWDKRIRIAGGLLHNTTKRIFTMVPYTFKRGGEHEQHCWTIETPVLMLLGAISIAARVHVLLTVTNPCWGVYTRPLNRKRIELFGYISDRNVVILQDLI